MHVETGYFGHGICHNLLMADRTKSVETRCFAVVRSRPRERAKDTIRGGARGNLRAARPRLGLGRGRSPTGKLASHAGELARGAHAKRTPRLVCDRHAHACRASASLGTAGRVCASSERANSPRAANRGDTSDAQRLPKRTGEQSAHAVQTGRRERARGRAWCAVARRRGDASRHAFERRGRKPSGRAGGDTGELSARNATRVPSATARACRCCGRRGTADRRGARSCRN